MKFIIQNINIPFFRETLTKITFHCGMDFPKAEKFEVNESTGYTTIILGNLFKYNLDKLNPNLIKLLMDIK